MAETLNELIVAQKEHFIRLNLYGLQWSQECLFARQQIIKNKYTTDVAAQNPGSLQAAILNVAAIGISLNPALAHAYLVPRDGKICLDISYRGLVKLATDAGAILWAKSQLVYANDTFEWLGDFTPPHHKADPFSNRGDLRGGYCLAKLPDGEFMVETMSIQEINDVRDTSKAYQKESGPWVGVFYPEMAKKTITKRASKSWPQTEKRERVDRAIEILNEHEGLIYTIEEQAEFMGHVERDNFWGLYQLARGMDDEKVSALLNSFPQGKKTEMKKKAREMLDQGYEKMQGIALDLQAVIDGDDEHGMAGVRDSLTQEVWGLVVANLSPEHVGKLDAMIKRLEEV